MAVVRSEKTEILSIKEIKKKLPKSKKKLNLKDASVGNQPEGTIIIGELKSVVSRKNSERPPKDLMKITLTEILENGNGYNFDVFLYGKFVFLTERILEDKCDSPAWMVLSNVLINKYAGNDKKWCPFSIKVRGKEDGSQELVLFIQNSSHNEPLIDYIPLNEIVSDIRQNIFAVVKEVVKPLTVLRNQSKHSMFALSDPSCSKPSSKRDNVLLHIFLNDPNENLPQVLKVGDILRVRDMLGDFFKNERMHGKIFSSQGVTIFEIVDDEVIPKTTNLKYKLTDQDEEYVRNLSQYWANKGRKEITLKDGNDSQDSILMENKICDITEPSTFNLYCMVESVCVVSAHRIVLLKVVDGTLSPVCTTIISLNNATQELCSSQELAVFQAKSITISVFKHLFTEATKLKSGDFIELVNVTCVHAESEEEKFYPTLNFYMKDVTCKIIKLKENSSWPRKIKKLIKENQLLGERKSQTISLSSFKNTRNCSSRVNMSVANSENPCESSLQPINANAITSTPYRWELCNGTPTKCKNNGLKEPSDQSVNRSNSNSKTREQKLFSPSPIKRPKRIKGNEATCEVTFAALNENLDIETSSNITSESSTAQYETNPPSYREFEVKKMQRTSFDLKLNKSKICLSRSNTTNKHLWQFNIQTVCDTYTKASLTGFYQNSKGGDKSMVWAILKHIHFLSENPCQDCYDIFCFHDWVWGLCLACGSTFSSNELRTYYTKEELEKNTLLPCKVCTKSKKPINGGNTDTVLPYMKLELCLEDLTNDNNFSIDLTGEGAEQFFGTECRFSWTVSSVPSVLHNKAGVLKSCSQNCPLKFCLLNTPKSDGKISIQVVNTKAIIISSC